MKREFFTVFLIGALLYGFIEVVFRNYTHWSMLLAGGTCFTLFYYSDIGGNNLIKNGLLAMTIITIIELIVGYIVNIKLKLNVWDYSYMSYNFKGQICLLYSTIWFFFGIPMNILKRAVKLCFIKIKKAKIVSKGILTANDTNAI